MRARESPLKRALNAHSTSRDAICQSQSGGNAILSVCFLSIMDRGGVTAGGIFIAAARTSRCRRRGLERKTPPPQVEGVEPDLPITTTAVFWHRDGPRCPRKEAPPLSSALLTHKSRPRAVSSLLWSHRSFNWCLNGAVRPSSAPSHSPASPVCLSLILM